VKEKTTQTILFAWGGKEGEKKSVNMEPHAASNRTVEKKRGHKKPAMRTHRGGTRTSEGLGFQRERLEKSAGILTGGGMGKGESSAAGGNVPKERWGGRGKGRPAHEVKKLSKAAEGWAEKKKNQGEKNADKGEESTGVKKNGEGPVGPSKDRVKIKNSNQVGGKRPSQLKRAAKKRRHKTGTVKREV